MYNSTVITLVLNEILATTVYVRLRITIFCYFLSCDDYLIVK